MCVNNIYLCPTQAFVEAVIGRLRSCVDEDVFIPLYPKKSVSFLLSFSLNINLNE